MKGVRGPSLRQPRNFFCSRAVPFEGTCQVLGFFDGRQPIFMHFPHFRGFMGEIQERGCGHIKSWMERAGNPQPAVFGKFPGPAQTTERVGPARGARGWPPARVLLPFKSTEIHRSQENDGTWRGISPRPLQDVVKIRGHFRYAFTEA